MNLETENLLISFAITQPYWKSFQACLAYSEGDYVPKENHIPPLSLGSQIWLPGKLMNTPDCSCIKRTLFRFRNILLSLTHFDFDQKSTYSRKKMFKFFYLVYRISNVNNHLFMWFSFKWIFFWYLHFSKNFIS